MERTHYEYLEEILNSKNVCDHLTGYQAMTIDALAELLSFCPYERLCELAKADREGRCVVLPCKLGDTVFKIGASICMWRETDHCDEYCNGYEYRDCWEGRRAVCEDKFSLDDLQRFGKNVFLTREAAEAALKAREQE